MNKMIKKGLLYSTIALSLGTAQSCSLLKSKKKKKAMIESAAKKDEKEKDKDKDEKIKDFKEVIKGKDTVGRQGLFNVYKSKDKFYFEILDSVFNRDLLITNRIDQAPFGLKISNAQYGGEKIDQALWNLKKNITEKRVDVISPNTSIMADSTKSMYKSVMNSNMYNIVNTFKIACFNKEKNGVLIDVTPLFEGNEEPFGISSSMMEYGKIGSFDGKRSQIDTIMAYKNNIEIKTTKTFSKAKDFPDGITFKLHSSILLLPKETMKMRINDSRIGFFGQPILDYDKNPQGVSKYNLAHRWKLVPKDSAAYLRGELVEPVKPIIIYIDPATPKQWVPYLIKGINDWQPAFENAGFKNAIFGKEAPTKEEDPEFDVNDVRYSVVRYFASDIKNAYGPHTSDPRSGEIIETHIGWYHNVMQLIKDWYRTQTGATTPASRPQELNTETLGELIRFVSSHEVGHTLGLAHNFGSSYAYTVAQLRDKAFTDSHGTAPSIMDYARFNYVAQPGDGVTSVFPKIGTYDKWAIKWGYSWFPESYSVEKEKEVLDQWMLSHYGDPEYFYGMQGENDDRRDQSEDLSNNAVEASNLGIENLKRILPELPKWTFEKDKKYGENLNAAFNDLIAQINRYSGHVARQVGSVRKNILMYGQEGQAFEYTDKKIQKEAVNFLNTQVFKTPSWIVNAKDVVSKLPMGNLEYAINSLQLSALRAIMDADKIQILSAGYQENSNNYAPTEFLNDLEKGIFNPASNDLYTRNLQFEFVKYLSIISKNKDDAGTLCYAKLVQLQKQLAAAKGNDIKSAHYLKLAKSIKNFLDNGTEIGGAASIFKRGIDDDIKSGIAPTTLDCFQEDAFLKDLNQH